LTGREGRKKDARKKRGGKGKKGWAFLLDPLAHGPPPVREEKKKKGRENAQPYLSIFFSRTKGKRAKGKGEGKEDRGRIPYQRPLKRGGKEKPKKKKEKDPSRSPPCILHWRLAKKGREKRGKRREKKKEGNEVLCRSPASETWH